jgi:hypothetical protein
VARQPSTSLRLPLSALRGGMSRIGFLLLHTEPMTMATSGSDLPFAAIYMKVFCAAGEVAVWARLLQDWFRLAHVSSKAGFRRQAGSMRQPEPLCHT